MAWRMIDGKITNVPDEQTTNVVPNPGLTARNADPSDEGNKVAPRLNTIKPVQYQRYPVQSNTGGSSLYKYGTKQEEANLSYAQQQLDSASQGMQRFNENPIAGYEDILSQYGPKESEIQRNERLKKEGRKRNLLALIQLGGALGNMVNATTGGHMGERSVQQADLVGAYDKGVQTADTRRLTRDAKREQARQNYINLNYKNYKGNYDNAMKRYQAAQKAYKDKLDADEKARKNELDANEKARMNDNNLAFKERQLKAQQQMNNARIQAQKDIAEARIQAQKDIASGKGSGGKTSTLPIAVEDGNTQKVFNISNNAIENMINSGSIMSYLTPKYQDKINSIKDDNNGKITKDQLMTIIGEYAQDRDEHKDLYPTSTKNADKWNLFKDLLGSLEEAASPKDFQFDEFFGTEELNYSYE